jgi:hypothetical protein
MHIRKFLSHAMVYARPGSIVALALAVGCAPADQVEPETASGAEAASAEVSDGDTEELEIGVTSQALIDAPFPGPVEVVVCRTTGARWSGCQVLGEGHYPRLSELEIGDNTIRGFIVGSDARVVLHPDRDFRGKFLVVEQSDLYISNATLSAISVMPKWVPDCSKPEPPPPNWVFLYTGTNFTGKCAPAFVGRYNDVVRNLGFPNDSLVSAKVPSGNNLFRCDGYNIGGPRCGLAQCDSFCYGVTHDISSFGSNHRGVSSLSVGPWFVPAD